MHRVFVCTSSAGLNREINVLDDRGKPTDEPLRFRTFDQALDRCGTLLFDARAELRTVNGTPVFISVVETVVDDAEESRGFFSAKSDQSAGDVLNTWRLAGRIGRAGARAIVDLDDGEKTLKEVVMKRDA